MSEQFDDLINGALGDFHAAESVSGGLVPGASAVRATVTHRRRVRLMSFSVLGALLVAAPIAVFAANPRGNNGPPTPGDSGLPTATAEISPSPSPSQAPSSSPSATPSLAPDGRATAAQLLAARVRTANWPGDCAARVAPAKNVHAPGAVRIEKVVHANLDADSALETAALIFCRRAADAYGYTQVMAYDRDTAGKIVSLGPIIAPFESDITGISARPGGGIIAVVAWSEFSPEPGDPYQEREFAWNGSAFKQVGGPTAFIFAKTDLSVTSTALKLGPARNGKRSGTVTVTVKNTGRDQPNIIVLQITTDGTGYQKVVGSSGNKSLVHGLKAGERAVLTYTVEVDANTTAHTLRIGLFFRADDPNSDNNRAEVPITR